MMDTYLGILNKETPNLWVKRAWPYIPLVFDHPIMYYIRTHFLDGELLAWSGYGSKMVIVP